MAEKPLAMKTNICRAVYVIMAIILSACAAQNQFTGLYNYYFPKTNDLRGLYRKGFDRFALADTPPPSGLDSTRYTPLYFAAKGDPKSFHTFLHHPDKDEAGQRGECWYVECLFLLIRLGDNRFADLLALENRETRESIGRTLEPQVNWQRHSFPKTRALYTFRSAPKTF